MPCPSFLRLSCGCGLAVGLLLSSGCGGGDDVTEVTEVIEQIQSPGVELVRLSTFASGQFNESAAEITTYCPDTQRLFIVNAQTGGIDVVDLSDPELPVFVESLDVAGDLEAAVDGVSLNAVNSASVRNGIVAVAVDASPKTDNGYIAFYDSSSLDLLGQTEAGALPDAVTISPDGRWVLVANEGESNDTFEIDPQGSVTIIDLGDGVAGITASHIRHLDFTAWNAGGARVGEVAELTAGGLRVAGQVTTSLDPYTSRPSTFAEDMEPEWVAINSSSTTAYVSLQENNAIAVIDIVDGSILRLMPLGFKNHGALGNEIDISDRDSGIPGASGNTRASINIRTWAGLYGVPMPDTIAVTTISGRDYILTANEGDARVRPDGDDLVDGFDEGDIFSDEAEIGDFDLVGSRFEGLDGNTAFGRLGLVRDLVEDHLDENGKPTRLFAYGARSFSIYDAEAGTLVFDSGSDFERITAQRFPEYFNASNSNNNLDNRSDNKGPEPEGIAVGVIDGRTYAFIGLERIGGVMVYDISNPAQARYITYRNDRNFDADVETAEAGDLGPEGLTFIPASQAGGDQPLLVVANEVSGTTAIYAVATLVAGGEAVGPADPVVVTRPASAPVSNQ